MTGMLISLSVAIFGGYALIALWSFATTMFLGTTFPHFAARKGRLQMGFLLSEGALWFIGCVAGAYLDVSLSSGFFRYITPVALCILVVIVVWKNAVELRPPMPAFAISALTTVGIVAGAFLKLQK